MSKNPITLPDAKWSCSGCGDCCKGFSFGPVENDIVEGLERLKIHEKWPAAQGGWRTRHPRSGDWYFGHVDGHCVFLRDDNLCAIHALFGEERKPWFCREYPFHVVREPRGHAVRVREDCGGYYKTHKTGALVSSQAREILSLPRTVPHQDLSKATIIVLPGLGVSPENWVQVERTLVEMIGRQLDPRSGAAELRDALFRMTGREMRPSGSHVQALSLAIESIAADMKGLKVSPALSEAKDEIVDILESVRGLASLPDLSFSEQALGFLNIVIRGRILGKTFCALGGFPQGMGCYLLETRLFSTTDAETQIDSLGPALARWRRCIMAPPFWATLKKNGALLTEIFLSA